MSVTPLPSLSPLGLGSPDAESLSSYAQRLAASQSIFPGQLVFRVLTWLDEGRPEMIGSWAKHPRRVRIGHNNNGFSHALVWLRLLQRLTGRADLEQLTTASWDHNFPTRQFQRSELAVCPHCLAEDSEPYHRLSWLLQAVKVCLHHRIALTSTCPRCEKAIPIIHDRSMVLMCPWCGGDLRHIRSESNTSEPTQYDMWAAREVGDIIAASSEWFRPLEWSSASALKALGVSSGLRDAAAFARFVGTSKSTAWYWFTARVRPTLPLALYTFHRFGVSLASQLKQGRSENPIPARAPQSQPEFRLRRVWLRTPRNWARIRKLLRRESMCPLPETRSLFQVSRAIGVDARTLRLRFPALCREISARHRDYKTSLRTTENQILRDQMIAAIKELNRAAIPANRRNTALALRQPDLFRRRNARAIFNQLATESLPPCPCSS
jgi:hypothetical protein